jgi:hypothetical protein
VFSAERIVGAAQAFVIVRPSAAVIGAAGIILIAW